MAKGFVTNEVDRIPGPDGGAAPVKPGSASLTAFLAVPEALGYRLFIYPLTQPHAYEKQTGS